MGWLGAALQTAVPMLSGRAAGQNEGFLLQRKLRQEDEDRKRQASHEALQAALLQSQTGYYNRRGEDRNIDPLSEAGVAAQLRLKSPPAERNIDPLSGEGIEAALKRHRGERGYDVSHPLPRTGTDDDPAFDANDPENHQKILNAYMQRSGQGHTDQLTGQWVPPVPPKERVGQAEEAYQEMVRLTGPFSDVQGGSSSAEAGTAPTAPTAPAAPGAKRAITPDQAEYLKAMKQWDPTKYEVQ